ncbi:hypothetical protein Xszus_00483 [Xenorhabdus szentirmaii]|nr:hypothetical protein Xszus_00483 [Xenorhabdus szentirmaii]
MWARRNCAARSGFYAIKPPPIPVYMYELKYTYKKNYFTHFFKIKHKERKVTAKSTTKFAEPEKVKLWKYMTFTKYIELISSKKLYLGKINGFRDIYEGTVTKHYKELHNKLVKQGEYTQQEVDDFFNELKSFEKMAHINCWHENSYESAAMWDLYGRTNESIAIETNFARLQNLLPDNVLLEKVKYLDYDSDLFPPLNNLAPFVHKRNSFKHENEVRIIKFENNNNKTGIKLDMNLNKLIEKVHVSPEAEPWFIDLVIEVTKKYQIKTTVVKSKLYNLK